MSVATYQRLAFWRRPTESLRAGVLVTTAWGAAAPEPGRLEIADGHVPAPQGTSVPYASYARVPKAPWRSLTAAELALLWSPGLPANPAEYVGVLKIPAEVLAPVHALGLNRVGSTPEFDAKLQTPEARTAAREVAAYLDRYRTNRCAPGPLPTVVLLNPPALPVITVDRSVQRYIGLHLDSWDRSPITVRQDATNRICINLGQEPRYFLFVNHTVAALARLVGATPTLKPTDLVKRYLESHPTYPVLKVRVDPGEAYIAPTENVIHDGSSEGKRTPDVQLTVRGHFSL